MSEFENTPAEELNLEEMNEVAGGKFTRPAEKKGFIIHQIQKGETLYKIANHYHVTVDQILSWNPKIKDRNKIYYGDYLYIKR